MQKKILFTLLFLWFAGYTSLWAQFYLPSGVSGQIVHHENYCLSYSEKHEQPFWVAYELTPGEACGKIARKDAFRPDPSVKTGSATLSDYQGSGYDRGHLAPAADMRFNSKAMSESFFMSNMAPQNPSFNRGIWRELENLVRGWAQAKDTLYVVTGPVFQQNKGVIGNDKVTIPGYFYKVVLKRDGTHWAMVAFLLPNEKGQGDLFSYCVSVDVLEQKTGLDFFAFLNDSVEESLEEGISLAHWASEGETKKKHAPQSDGQCIALTKKGDRCKRKAQAGSKYCFQHKR